MGGIAPAGALAASAAALTLIRPRGEAAAALSVALVAIVGAEGGLLLGAARLRAIDAGAYAPDPGTHLALSGYVAAVPRRSDGTVRVRVQTPGGRLAIEAPEPVPDLPIGDEVRAAGVIVGPPPWLKENLRLHGVSRILRAPRIALTSRRRGGVVGRIDAIRSRAERALGRGTPAQEAFQRSGLAHHLAVSGENVVLLVVLATPLLAALGIPLRARLIWLLALIALYVPLAGGGA